MRRLTIALLATCLLGASAATALAEEESLPPWSGGQRAETERGLVVTVPDGWVAWDLEADAEEQLQRRAVAGDDPDVAAGYLQTGVELLHGLQQRGWQLFLMRSGTPDECSFRVEPATEKDFDSRAAKLDSRVAGIYESASNDKTTTYVEPPRAVELPAGTARLMAYDQRMQEVADVVRQAVLYFGEGRDATFTIFCLGMERPDDDWLSIAETFWFLPLEG